MSATALKDASDVFRAGGADLVRSMDAAAAVIDFNADPGPESEPDAGSDALREALDRSVLSIEDFREREIPPREKLLGNWFCEGDLGFVFAPRGVGKTWFSIDLAVCLSTAGKMGDWTVPVAVPTVYVDGEMPPDALRDRMIGMGAEGGNLHVLSHQILFDEGARSLNITDAGLQAALLDKCLRLGAKVLVLDNLSTLAAGMSENDSDEWEKVLSWLLNMRRSGIAVVIVHHAGRNGQMRGTSRREDAAFWVISLTDAKGTNADTLGARFITRFTKPSRNTQEGVRPIEWHYQTYQATGDVLRSFKPADDLVVFRQLVGEGVGKCNELAQEMGVSAGTISKLAKKGKTAGWLAMANREYVLVDELETGNEEGSK